MIVPRYYQSEAHDAVFQYFRDNPDPDRNPVIAMPTGTGKAVVIAMLCTTILQRWPGQRILMLVHTKELVDQNAQKLRGLWPQAPLGIYAAGLKLKEYSMPITFASIQSAAKNPHLFGHIDLVLVDECHLFSPEETAAYQKLIKFLRQRNEWLRVIGLSATIYRLGLGMITDNGVFTDVCYDVTSMAAFNRLLDEGYLCNIVPMPTQAQLDIKGVHRRGGDFNESQLGAAVNAQQAVTIAGLREMMEATWGVRKKTLIFATDIEHVEFIHSVLQSWGVKSGFVHSKMKGGRDKAIEDFKGDGIDYLINKDILTTGFDMPELDCIALFRPTMSPVLHVQMLGRLTRPFYLAGMPLDTSSQRLEAMALSSKPNGLVLDFAGNTMRLGPINDPRIPKKKGEGTGDIPIKVCSDSDTPPRTGCSCMNHISARVCVNCGEPFTFEVKIEAKASTAALIVRDEPQVEWFDVDRVEYHPHNANKPGAIPSLKVTYRCGIQRFPEWVCLWHDGNNIQHKANSWWKQRSPWAPPPGIGECIEYLSYNPQALKIPKRIRVWVNKKNPEVKGYDFGE